MTSAGVRAGLSHPGAIVVRNLLLVVGLTTFAGLSWQIGPERIIAHLQPLGWRFVLVFLPYLLVFVCDTVGWRYAFERRPPVHFVRLLAIHVIGKAANIITPLVPVGGEPIKAYLLQVGGIPFTEGLASAVIARTVATIAHGLFVLAMTGFTVVHLGLPMPLLQAIAAAFMIGVVLVGTFLVAQTHGLFASVLGIVHRLTRGLASLQEGARDLDRRLARYYRQRRGRFALAMTCHLLGWLVEGVEVYVLLMLLHLPPSPAVALGVVALSSAVRAASFMVPGSLGIQEGGNVFIFGSFGLPPDAAMAFSLLRRIREWGWAAAGLLLVRRLTPEQRLSLAAARAGGR
jgi:uncharacterized protein (TIRG00374 family)